MPTLMEVAAAKYPKHYLGMDIHPYEGQSLVPTLQNKRMERLSPLFWQWSNGKAVRHDKWKLVKWGNKSDWELYDMTVDRTETNDLAKKHPDVVKKYVEMYDAWFARTQETPKV